jgi:hypothetical protein
MRFCKSVVIGEPPSKSHSSKINNGTITFVNLGKGPIGITCAHVIDGYRHFLDYLDSPLFQIGGVAFDPLAQLIDESAELDLATIRFTEEQESEITKGGEIGSAFIQPRMWPPQNVRPDQFVMFGGFPGATRERYGYDEIVSSSWSSGLHPVASTHEERFSIQFEREFWRCAFGYPDQCDLRELGGMSGGPAFVDRGMHFELVGFIYEYSAEFDLMFFRHASSVAPDGTINRLGS